MTRSFAQSGWITSLIRLWEGVARPHPSLADLGDRRRARLLMAFALVLGVMLAIGAFASIRSNGIKITNVFLLGFTLACFLAYGLGRTRRYRWGSLILTIGFSAMGYAIVWGGSDSPDSTLFSIIPLALVLGSALLPVRGQLLLLGGNILALAGLNYLTSLPYAPEAMLDGGVFFTMGALLILVTIFRNSLEKARLTEIATANQELRAIQNTLEERVERRTQALESARREAEEARLALETEIWLTNGQLAVNAALRGQQSMSDLALCAVQAICDTLEAPIGALFIWQSERLQFAGGRAFIPSSDQPAPSFALGEGLIGQVALEQQPLILKQVPPGYFDITSGLGEAAPEQIAIWPLRYNDQLAGVIEMGLIKALAPQHEQFLQRALESVAAAMQTAQARTRIDELLMETQAQAEELQTREEELRAINEELEAQAEALKSGRVSDLQR